MIPISISPEVAYATKTNIRFPGTAAQATAARAKVKTDIEDRTAGFTVTVAAGSIVGS